MRVDILERLADLIRPALAWRETSPGEKPAGAFDGRGFVVTQAMTSLTGSAGEDFASILRALGYRMERRPPPPPKPAVVETPAAEAAPAEIEAAPSPRRRPRRAAAEAASEAAGRERCEPATEVATTLRPPSGVAEPAPAAEEVAASSATLLPEVAFAPNRRDEPSASEPLRRSEAPERAEAGIEAAPSRGRPRRRRQSRDAPKPPAERCSGEAAPAAAAADAPPSPNWSKSGGPAAAPTSAGRAS